MLDYVEASRERQSATKSFGYYKMQIYHLKTVGLKLTTENKIKIWQVIKMFVPQDLKCSVFGRQIFIVLPTT